MGRVVQAAMVFMLVDAAAQAVPRPGGLQLTVKEVSITANGARSDGVSGEETKAQCSRFRLRLREVRIFFAVATQVDQRAYQHDLEASRCHAEGRVTFTTGERGSWSIDIERRGLILLTDGRPIYLYCKACTSRRFEPVYDPDRDG